MVWCSFSRWSLISLVSFLKNKILWYFDKKRLDQWERHPPDFHLKKLVPWLEPRLAQWTTSLACSADQLHRESVGIMVFHLILPYVYVRSLVNLACYIMLLQSFRYWRTVAFVNRIINWSMFGYSGNPFVLGILFWRKRQEQCHVIKGRETCLELQWTFTSIKPSNSNSNWSKLNMKTKTHSGFPRLIDSC